jgi:hypothetical protein
MRTRLLLAAIVAALAFMPLAAQTTSTNRGDANPAGGAWRATSTATKTSSKAAATADAPPLKSVDSTPRGPIAKVAKGPDKLPTDAGQEWRDYDITPYTDRATATTRPEQAIVDWILRETGYEAWHSEPLGFLSANRKTLRVYHTPQMQRTVQEMVDRFVNPAADGQAFGLRVVSLDNPAWRARSQKLLNPVATQTQGVQAWLLAKEDAALLLAELRKRNDYREHSSPHILVPNAQSTVVSVTRPRNYIQHVVLQGVWPGFEPRLGQIDEGLSLEFQPLLSTDLRAADAIVKCHVDQVERLVPVMLDVPTPVAQRQRTRIDVPQMASCRLHERFRWPTDQVLLVSLGMVASPLPASPGLTANLGLAPAAARSEMLVFMESKGKAPVLPSPAGATTPTALKPSLAPKKRSLR